MLKLIADHRFTRGARVAVYQVHREKGVRPEDCLLLEFTVEGGRRRGWYLRPDEAMLVIECLASGVYAAVDTYGIDSSAFKGQRR